MTDNAIENFYLPKNAGRHERIDAVKAQARKNLSFEEAVHLIGLLKVLVEDLQESNEELITRQRFTMMGAEGAIATARESLDSAKSAIFQIEQAQTEASNRGKAAAEALHSKPGNSRDKRESIRTAWASGKYSSRDLCAEQECAALNMAPGTARKALRNTPEPPRRCTA